MPILFGDGSCLWFLPLQGSCVHRSRHRFIVLALVGRYRTYLGQVHVSYRFLSLVGPASRHRFLFMVSGTFIIGQPRRSEVRISGRVRDEGDPGGCWAYFSEPLRQVISLETLDCRAVHLKVVCST
jgi:hypothetical protein